MNSGFKLLTSRELKEEFKNIPLYKDGLDGKRAFLSQHFIIPKVGPLNIPLNTELRAQCWHVGPLWLNNWYSNYLN